LSRRILVGLIDIEGDLLESTNVEADLVDLMNVECPTGTVFYPAN